MQDNKQQTYKFHIRGMHCKACELLTESELKEFPYIKEVKASLRSSLVEVVGEFDGRTPSAVAEEVNKVLEKHHYALSAEKTPSTTLRASWKEFYYAIPITILFVIFYVFLQKIGLVNMISGNKVSYGAAFVIGIIASLSSCMAVVGGLLLSMSATFAKEGNSQNSAGASKFTPQIMFHTGRIVSFFVLGGVIGALGSVFQLNAFGNFILGVIIGLVMLVMGINLLDIFPWAKKLQPGIPKFFSRHALGISKLNHTLTPLLVGVATFFLPCGFTQSMQIYTLSTGNFVTGALSMLSFALGTFPVLLIISFSSYSIKNSRGKGIFWKTAGLIVILFAIFNLLNALVIIGIINPIFNF